MIIKQTLGKLKVEDFRSLHRTFTSDEGNGAFWEPLLLCNLSPSRTSPAHPSTPLTAWWGKWALFKEEGRGRQGRAWESPPPPNNCPLILPINSEFSAYTNSALEMQMHPGKINPMGHSEKNAVLQGNYFNHTKSFTQHKERALGVVIGRGWGQAASGGGGSRDLGPRGDSGMREWLCP